MEQIRPRVLLAGTGSGCGKTSLTCAVLLALAQRGVRLAACKCGPDYIDPMFHSRVVGVRSTTLDAFFFAPSTLKSLLAQNGAERGVTILEGVMGYYDGIGLDGRASTWEIARLTKTPVVLVVDARGAALSILAVIEGFRTFMPQSCIRGVILNRCSAGTYRMLEAAIQQRFDGQIRPLGYLPVMPECGLESRHLGLVTAAEVEELQEKLMRLAHQAGDSIDLDGLLELAGSAPPLSCEPISLPQQEPVRIAVAQDTAFSFYYAENLEVLRAMGAQLVPFSPLTDPALPAGIHGLYLGGGYPELHARQLSENHAMRNSVAAALAGGLPCIAECGGFMYLTEAIGEWPMVGFLPGRCFDAGKLTRFGYVTLSSQRENLLCGAGEEIRGHEFHRWDCTCPGGDLTARKPTGRSWTCGVATERLYAGFPHFHFHANLSFARRFYEICLKEKRSHD